MTKHAPAMLGQHYVIEASPFSRGIDYIATTLPGWRFVANDAHVLVEGSRKALKPRLAYGVVLCPSDCECKETP